MDVWEIFIYIAKQLFVLEDTFTNTSHSCMQGEIGPFKIWAVPNKNMSQHLFKKVMMKVVHTQGRKGGSQKCVYVFYGCPLIQYNINPTGNYKPIIAQSATSRRRWIRPKLCPWPCLASSIEGFSAAQAGLFCMLGRQHRSMKSNSHKRFCNNEFPYRPYIFDDGEFIRFRFRFRSFSILDSPSSKIYGKHAK